MQVAETSRNVVAVCCGAITFLAGYVVLVVAVNVERLSAAAVGLFGIVGLAWLIIPILGGWVVAKIRGRRAFILGTAAATTGALALLGAFHWIGGPIDEPMAFAAPWLAFNALLGGCGALIVTRTPTKPSSSAEL
jgi:hypothetical protein